MKRFLRQVLVSALGVLVAGVLFLGIIIGAGILFFEIKSSPPKLQAKSILHIPLRGQVVAHLPTFEKANKDFIDLLVLQKAIKDAQQDSHIQGMYLEVGDLVAGWATLEEIRASLQAFKDAGKFVIAYGERYNSKSYYLASLADELLLHPAGSLLFNGLSMTVLFYKRLLDKLEIVPEVFRVGRYKSAIEPYISHGMSEASKEQSTVLLTTIYKHIIHKIAVARKLSVAALKRMANDLSVLHPQGAYKASLITQIGHADDAAKVINNKLGVPVDKKIKYVGFRKYKATKLNLPLPKNQIAVLTASGVIMDEPGIPNTIHTADFIKNLKKLKKDPTIKAIVLRINSPGGSAVASDSMWKAVMLAKEEKPIVASMADVAASGGYYMATACHTIVAHPTTITGSIGIFSLYFSLEALLKNKLGITGDVIKTSPSADLFSISRPLSSYEKSVLQKQVEQGYHTFLERVATGRNMDQAVVARLAEGRVWPGVLAKKHGLIDELGGLDDAITKAADLAGLQADYEVTYWPKPKSWLQEKLIDWEGVKSKSLKHHILERISPLQSIQDLVYMQGNQARLPYTIEIE